MKRDNLNHSGTVRNLTDSSVVYPNQKSTVRHPNLFSAKPVQDFNTRANGIGKIKENTDRLYKARFDQMLEIDRINKEQDAIMSMCAEKDMQHHSPMPKREVEQFNEQDTFVTSANQFGIFPAADFKYFPLRDPNALGWQVGLRSYFRHKKDRHRDDLHEDSTADSHLPALVGVSGEGAGALAAVPGINLQGKPTRGQIVRVNSLLGAAEQKRSQYAVPDLPDLNPAVEQRYFGPRAKTAFHDTYRQLKRRGEIMRGGYDELGDTILLAEEANVMRQSVATLEQLGVLTPRTDWTSATQLVPQSIDGSGIGSGEQGRDVFWARDPQSPSKFSFSAADLAHHAPSELQGKEGQETDGQAHRDPLEVGAQQDLSLQDTYAPQSPRAIFLAGCLRNNVPPITTALIRKRLSPTINLAHMGLGNAVAMVLAPALSSMPHLQVLNLTDNNLADSGLAALIRSIAAHPAVQILDISQNVIGSEAADALASFIGNPDCRLQCLRMSDSNIDDGECARFVDLLMNNVHLKELDMSKNLLGKDENLNAVQPDFVTGGESLSELLRHESCPIQILNLRWNMIRLEGAEVLCDSIRANRTLTHLNLSFNALGRSAAEVLGAALIHNYTIRELDVANNGIDPIGCFAILVGVRENRSLQRLTLDENPIGELGGRILVKVAASDGHRLHISAVRCDVTIRSSEVKLNINDPFGTFEFDLSRSYDRACVLEVLDLAAADPSIEIGSFEFSPPEAKTVFQALKIKKFVQERVGLSAKELGELSVLRSLCRINQVAAHQMDEAVRRFDLDGSEMVPLECVSEIFAALDMQCNSDFLAEIKFAMDTRELGVIDVNDLVEYIMKRGQMAVDRIRDITHKVVCSLSTDPLVRYIPPFTGTVRIRVLEGYSTGNEFRTAPISHTKVKQVIETANASSNPLVLLLYSLDCSTVYLEEARVYFNSISRTEDSVATLANILMHMHGAGDAMRLIKSVVGNDIVRIRRLKQALGNAYGPLIGVYSGYYTLDLSNERDRLCLKKLIERSILNENSRKKKRKWDTSQHGHWNCFRNELHHPTKGSTAADMTISPKHYFPIPKHGRLEFDFVNTERPDPATCRPVHEDRLIDCLLISRLLHEDQIDLCISRLAELSIACRKTFISNGSPHWKPELGRALLVGDTLHAMYCNLDGRSASVLRSAKKEVVKAAPVSPVVKEKKKATESKNIRPSMLRQQDLKPMALMATDKTKEMITKFRSIVNKGLAQFGRSPWRRRLFEVMLDTKGASDEYKSAALLEYFEAELTTVWLCCKYVALVLEFFKMGAAAKSCVGSYRVHLLVQLFDRIVDLHNFELVLMVLSAEEHAAVLARIGILNVFNPYKPEGGWQLDLSRWDERQVAKMQIHLSVVEPGENWTNKSFIFDHGFNAIPGWDLNVTWLTEEGLPKKGILAFEMFAGDGLNLLGCLVDKRLRCILTSLVLVEQRDPTQEIESESMLTVEHNMVLRKGAKTPINYYPDLTKPGNHSRPTLPLLKLITQSEVFPLLTKDCSGGAYSVEDANGHLAGTDVSWNYTSTIQKSDLWQL